MILNWKKMNNLHGLYKKVWKLSLHPETEMYMAMAMEMEIFINLYRSHIRQDSGKCIYFFIVISCLNMLFSCPEELFPDILLYSYIVMRCLKCRTWNCAVKSWWLTRKSVSMGGLAVIKLNTKFRTCNDVSSVNRLVKFEFQFITPV